MKIKLNPFAALLATSLISLSSSALAADRIKQNNTIALNDAGSWDILPGPNDVAVWNSTVTGANTTLYGGNLDWQGIRIANPGGLVTIGTSSASPLLTLGTAGIDLSAATNNLAVLGSVVAGTNQTWTVDGGRTLQLFVVNTNSELTGSGNIALSKGGTAGTAIFDFRPGQTGSTGFTDQGGFYDYTGNWTINAGAEARSLRNGRNAWGSGTITLNGGTIAEQQNYNGTWTNNIILQTGSSSTIDDRNNSGTRTLKLQGVISGDGNLTFSETGNAAMVAAGGYILTGANTMSGTLTLTNTASFVRVGGIGGEITSTAAGPTGSLGTTTVINNGTLTFTRDNTHTVANAMSGSGALNVGVPGILPAGQILTLAGNNTYTGDTTVNAGRLNITGSLTSPVTLNGGTIGGTGSTTEMLTISGTNTTLALAGGSTTTGLKVNGATFNTPILATFDTNPIPGTVYDVLTYGAGTVTTPFNLTVGWRGTLANDANNMKYIFTAGAAGIRTWNTTDGYWTQGLDANFAEGDKLFFGGDTVIFNNPAVESFVTLEGKLVPASVTVTNTNAYTFDGTGSLGGDMPLTKAGPGMLTLATANTYTGATTINGGTVKFVSGTNITTSEISIASGAVFEWAPTVSNVTFSGNLTGTGKVLRSGTGVLVNSRFTGDNSAFNGSWEATGGSIGFVDDATVGMPSVGITLDGGAVYFSTNGQTLAATRTITLGAAGGIWNGSTGNTTTVAAKITGIGGLTKISGETTILTGINDYTGNTAVNTGTVNLADDSQLKFVIGANGVNNQITGGGTLLLNGDFNLDLSGANTTSGNTWNLVNVTTLAETFGTTFSLIGFTENADVHTMVAGPVTYTFTEATGDLTVAPTGANDYNNYLALYTFPQGADTSPTGDPDQDGLTNNKEYAFGLNPTSGASVTPITANLNKTTGIFKYTRRATTGLTYSIETSTNLVTWTVDSSATSGQMAGPVNGVGNQEVTVTVSGAPLSATALFVRVKAN